MGICSSCACETSDDKCSTPFGSCSSGMLKSSCMKSAEEEAAKLEAIIDARLKEAIHTHVTPVIEKHVGTALASAIESGLFKAINYDLVPRHSAPASLSLTTRRLNLALEVDEEKAQPDIV